MSELTINDCRPEVIRFAIAMERKLRANDHKGGWKDCTKGYLLSRLSDEMAELRRFAVRRIPDSPAEQMTRRDADYIRDEAADVGNFAMMLMDIAQLRVPACPLCHGRGSIVADPADEGKADATPCVCCDSPATHTCVDGHKRCAEDCLAKCGGKKEL